MLPSALEALELIPDICLHPDRLASILGNFVTEKKALLAECILHTLGLDHTVSAGGQPGTSAVTWQFTMPVDCAQLKEHLSVWKICDALHHLSSQILLMTRDGHIRCNLATFFLSLTTAVQVVLRHLPGMQFETLRKHRVLVHFRSMVYGPIICGHGIVHGVVQIHKPTFSSK